MSARTSLPPEFASSPHVLQLVSRGRESGHISADELRQAFTAADIPMIYAKAVLRSLSEEGVTVMVTADPRQPEHASDDIGIGMHRALATLRSVNAKL